MLLAGSYLERMCVDLDVGAFIFSPLLFPAALVLQAGFLHYDVGDIRGNATSPFLLHCP